MRKTYYVHEDASYTGGAAATLTVFVGTWRELLEELCGVDKENRDVRDPEDPADIKLFPGGYSDEELAEMISQANGDGQNYTTVFEEVGEQTSDNEPPTFKQVLG
jgi:hypothetical protein